MSRLGGPGTTPPSSGFCLLRIHHGRVVACSSPRMVRGRPKITVPPCRFCNMSFKRVEHLRRHERIRGLYRCPSHTRVLQAADTQEKPFLCGCGQGFSRKYVHLGFNSLLSFSVLESPGTFLCATTGPAIMHCRRTRLQCMQARWTWQETKGKFGS